MQNPHHKSPPQKSEKVDEGGGGGEEERGKKENRHPVVAGGASSERFISRVQYICHLCLGCSDSSEVSLEPRLHSISLALIHSPPLLSSFLLLSPLSLSLPPFSLLSPLRNWHLHRESLSKAVIHCREPAEPFNSHPATGTPSPGFYCCCCCCCC